MQNDIYLQISTARNRETHIKEVKERSSRHFKLVLFHYIESNYEISVTFLMSV